MYVLQEFAAAPTVPWANGAGVTTELVSFEASRALSTAGAVGAAGAEGAAGAVGAGAEGAVGGAGAEGGAGADCAAGVEGAEGAEGAVGAAGAVGDASDAASANGVDPWRLSIARLDAPAPFSPLPGVERTFMPLDGALTLVVDGRAHELEPGTPLQFSGEAEVVLDRLPAPCRALNLMVRGPRPGRIVAADGSGHVPDGTAAALAILRVEKRAGEGGDRGRGDAVGGRRPGEEILVVTPGITPLTPRPHRRIRAEAVRFFLIPG